MITLLSGADSFETERILRSMTESFDGVAEKIDGTELQARDLPDILASATLFADKRLVIIKSLSENKTLWPDFYKWLPRVSDDISLVLVETKLDKRTVSYKELKKVAELIETTVWEDRDSDKAEQWLEQQAKQLGVRLDKNNIRLIVRRVGVDKWQLYHALEKLSLAETIDQGVIETLIDAQPTENVFHLFSAALRGERETVSSMIKTLELSEDPYRLFGLLSSQVFQLAAVVSAAPADNVSRDFGMHPYAVSQLQSTAKRLGRSGVKKAVSIFARTDDDMKLSRGEPWLLIERALIEVSTL